MNQRIYYKIKSFKAIEKFIANCYNLKIIVVSNKSKHADYLACKFSLMKYQASSINKYRRNDQIEKVKNEFYFGLKNIIFIDIYTHLRQNFDTDYFIYFKF